VTEKGWNMSTHDFHETQEGHECISNTECNDSNQPVESDIEDLLDIVSVWEVVALQCNSNFTFERVLLSVKVLYYNLSPRCDDN
jgi:hypothetical protein